VAEPGEQHAGRERRRGDVDGVVAEEQRADQALALRQQAIDETCVAVSLLLQPRHAGARRRCERCLAAGEERRQQQADQDDDKREPVVLGHLFASISVRNARTSAGSTLFSTKPWPMPRTRMKVSAPRFTFLSCAINVINVPASGTPPVTSFR